MKKILFVIFLFVGASSSLMAFFGSTNEDDTKKNLATVISDKKSEPINIKVDQRFQEMFQNACKKANKINALYESGKYYKFNQKKGALSTHFSNVHSLLKDLVKNNDRNYISADFFSNEIFDGWDDDYPVISLRLENGQYYSCSYKRGKIHYVYKNFVRID